MGHRFCSPEEPDPGWGGQDAGSAGWCAQRSAWDFDFRTAHLEDVDLHGTTFGGTALFGEATFSGDTWFDGATFSGEARFDEAAFSGDARFDEAAFAGLTSFIQTDFGRGAIAFENPQQWGPPAPRFDWDRDPVDET